MRNERSSLLPTAPAAPEKLAAVEGFRVLFTNCIILMHYADSEFHYPGDPTSKLGQSNKNVEVDWFSNLIHIGGDIVLCFFVISGFVTQLPGRPAPTGHRARARFVVQKLLRLAPMYYTSIFLFVLLIPAMQDCGKDSENVPLVGLLFALSVRALPSYGTVHLEACTAQSY